VKDDIDSFEDALQRHLAQVTLNDLHARQARQILTLAGREIVDNADTGSGFHEPADKIAADESRPARN